VNGNSDDNLVQRKKFNQLILRGDDEKITNKLAVTSLLYRFKVFLLRLKQK